METQALRYGPCKEPLPSLWDVRTQWEVGSVAPGEGLAAETHHTVPLTSELRSPPRCQP